MRIRTRTSRPPRPRWSREVAGEGARALPHPARADVHARPGYRARISFAEITRIRAATRKTRMRVVRPILLVLSFAGADLAGPDDRSLFRRTPRRGRDA